MEQTIARHGCRASTNLVCHCFAVSEGEVRDAIDILGARSVEDITRITGAGGGCKACQGRLWNMLCGLPPTCGEPPACTGCGADPHQCVCSAAPGFLAGLFAEQAARSPERDTR